MQNSNSKLNTVLLFIIIILLSIGIYIFASKKNTSENIQIVPEQPKVPQTDLAQNSTSTKEYKSTKLGFSFLYPSSWGSVNETLNQWESYFEYQITFSNNNALYLAGLSYPYGNAGRESYSGDFTEAMILGLACDSHVNEVIKSREGVNGVYTLAQFTTGLGDCSDYTEEHWAVYDVNKKVTNIVFEADPNKVSKTDFLNLVTSISF